MSEGQIPVNLGDLPIDTTPLDESAVYSGTLEKVALASKTDKNGNIYCALQLQVSDGDFEGQTIMMNYLPLPQVIPPDASKGVRIKMQNMSVSFARFCRAFKITGRMPAIESLADSEAIGRWQEWIGKFYGNTGKFTVRNQEFPEGSGRLRSGVSDFLF